MPGDRARRSKFGFSPVKHDLPKAGEYPAWVRATRYRSAGYQAMETVVRQVLEARQAIEANRAHA